MKKRVSNSINQLVWVGMRVTGVVLLVSSLVSVLNGALIALFLLSNGLEGFFQTMTPTHQNQIKQVSAAGFSIPFMQFIFGLYLLVWGKALHRLLTRIPCVDVCKNISPFTLNKESSSAKMQRQFNEFIESKGDEVPNTSKERHEQFRIWLKDQDRG